MAKDKIWLSSPHMGGHEQKFIQEAFDENWVAPLGPNVNGFEEDLQQYVAQNKSIAALSSGTAAIHLALIMLDVQPGDFVICQSMTFSASANPIKYQGAHPVFIDSEKETWNLCPKHVEAAIKGTIEKHGVKPKAIIGVHLYGTPYQSDEINAIAYKYDIPVIEDAAEALGSKYKDQKCGTLSKFGILSFNGNKIITTSGGGALITASSEEKQRVIFFATQSRDQAPHYQHSEVGYNYRMSNITAGIGRGQMMILDKHVELRRANFEFYKSNLGHLAGFEFVDELEGIYSNRWLSAVLIHEDKAGFSREDLRLALEKENIETRPLWKPMHMQPVFADCDYYGDKVAEQLFNIGLCLPSGSNLTDNDRDRILKAIMEVVNS
ncbi:DegT/DnrJ/EryC1/StrS family aminotransferase [Brumimicrobium aurantiacum]|uniref:Aminotransferase class I/II-fold pyridoxal phosphate-dependent enzyme n=1 Tax=Brumimicrobium aurantiacum TaxID=1737063 RepID=A0A3E1F0I7_9FLAO|nr:aminotransferase class I/II-fold pyridoxal phosphate-dependent enzyme [Brumimicrobium aurantiacum]RFC55326.1 aminotransferase class I/II-fold pyridoxal phosphate-dependent enzyme [Brumimicrobium aurantiacum]